MAIIQNIRLQQFRSYEDASFEFEDGVNIIVGPNGSGKTNLLEAILAIATGTSYRVTDAELVMFGKPWARLDAAIDGQQRTLKLVQEPKASKQYILDDKPLRQLGMRYGVPVVLFEPNHLQLLHGQPDARRNYLDDLLEQTVPGFQTARRHYRRVLSQRNALLKHGRLAAREQLFVWNLRLSELGGAIVSARAQLLSALDARMPAAYDGIAGGSTARIGVRYESRLPIRQYESALLHALESTLEKDLERGFTGFGPHRDDFSVLFNGRPAAEVASRGETRTALLAMKTYELEIIGETRGQKPLLLLDDVFSELDGKRRHSLASYLQTHQTFITTTDADLVTDKKLKNHLAIAL